MMKSEYLAILGLLGIMLYFVWHKWLKNIIAIRRKPKTINEEIAATFAEEVRKNTKYGFDEIAIEEPTTVTYVKTEKQDIKVGGQADGK